MWLIIVANDLPFAHAPSNLNYFIHVRSEYRYLDDSFPIVLLHYHNSSVDRLGRIQPPVEVDDREKGAVALANAQIDQHFNNQLFWDFRYSEFGDLGSGVGSRGDNLLYKRQLLIDQGIQRAASVLDVGCGDLEVLKVFALKNYLGLDTSEAALRKARLARPDWDFQLFDSDAGQEHIDPRDLVLCFEVLFH